MINIELQVEAVLGNHNRAAILDVAEGTGWTVEALRSIVGEEISHSDRHCPYCYAIWQRAEVLRLR